MLRWLQKAFQAQEVNWVPWPDTMSSGIPYVLNSWWNGAVAVFIAMGRPFKGMSLQNQSIAI